MRSETPAKPPRSPLWCQGETTLGADAPLGISPTIDDKQMPPSRRLAPAEWMEIRVDYEHGIRTVPQLSKQFGISRQALHKRLRKHGCTFGSKFKRVEEEISKRRVSEFAEKRAEMLEQTQKEVYNAARLINFKIQNLLVGSEKSKIPVSALDKEFKTLRTAAVALNLVHAARVAALGLKPEAEGAEENIIEIRDLSKERIESIRASNHDERLILACRTPV